MIGATVDVTHLTKTYQLGDGSQLKAADDVTLHIDPGTSVALTGPSGSGKSTLLHLIGAIDVPDSGTIVVDDVTVTSLGPTQLADYRARVGFIFQQFHLIPALSLLDNVCAPFIGRRLDAARRAHARELLAAVGLTDREDALPSQLSGGQQQRVAIARALVAEPSLLLGDEPTGNLDSATSEEIMELLLTLHREVGATIVLATHDEEIAASLSRTVHVRDGRVTG